MASLQELEAALINADRAGDGNAARILAKEISIARRQQALYKGGGAPGVDSETGAGGVSPGPMARLGRGFVDFGMASQQLTLPKDKAEELTRLQDAEIARYEKDRGADAGFDAMRFAGNVLPTLPFAGGATLATERVLGTRAAGPLARSMLGAAEGAGQGALTYTPEGQSKGKQVLLGAASGTLAPILSDAVSKLAAKATQFGRAQAMKIAADPDKIIAELEPVLAEQGVKWGELTQEVRNGMIQQARRQMAIGGDVDPQSLVRKQEIEEVLGPNAGPTRGQVTRDPREWTWERNTQKLPVIGNDITSRFQAQLQRLEEVARDAIKRSGGTALNDYQAGASATGALRQKMGESGTVVDEMYDIFRKSGAGGTEVNAAPIADSLGKVTEEYGAEHIPAAVRSRMESFGMLGGKQTKLLTVDEAEKLRKLIGNNIDPRNAPQQAALSIIKRSIDDAVKATDAPGVPGLQEARAAAAQRFALRDSSAGMSAAAADDEPDKFFRKYVLNGNVADLRGLKAALNSSVMGDAPPPGLAGYEPAGSQAWRDLKGRVLDSLVTAAQSQGAGSFSGKSLQKAMAEIGDERLKVILEPKEFADLQKLARVAYNVTAEPSLAAVNHSGTAPALVQFLQDAQGAAPRLLEAGTRIPFVGKVAAGAWKAGDDMAKSAEMRRRVSQALGGDVINGNEKYLELAKLLAGYTDPMAATGLAGYAGYKSR